ncbi:MAG: ABC transporter substrate binding protein [Candidatus Omnitrophota bacterium]
MKSFQPFEKKSPFFLLWGFLILPLVLFFQVERGLAKDVRRILLVHSGHEDSPWVKDVTQGVHDALKDSPVLLESFYMDTFRNPSIEWKLKVGRQAQEKIREFKPDAVIAVDDDAQKYVTQQYIGSQNPFFVFCGVNDDLDSYGLPAVNTTGIVERPHFEEAVAFLKMINPRIKKVAVLSDNSPDSMGAYAFLTHNPPAGIKVLGYHIIADFPTWQERVRDYNNYADALFVYLYNTVKLPGTNESLPSRDIIQWTLNHADIPVVGFFNFAVEDGMMGAVGESGYDHGMEAGAMALKLVNGVPLQNLPWKRVEKVYKMLNLPALQASGMTLSEEQFTGIDWIKK